MKRGGRIFLWILFGLSMVVLVSFITQQLWNWLVPELFAGPHLSFWQALGLLVLTKILFSGLGRKFHRDHHHATPYWKSRLREKFSGMTPEERDAFRKKMRQKWQKWCPDEYDPSAEESGNSNG